MQRRLGAFTTIADGTAEPSGDGVGTSIAALPGRQSVDWLTKITIVATGAFDFTLGCRMRDGAGAWGPLGQLEGDINGGASFSGAGAGTFVKYIPAESLGVATELYYKANNATNVTVTVAIAPYVEG